MATEMQWFESHVGSLGRAIDLTKKLHWDIYFFEGEDGKWYVKNAEQVILSTDSREVVDAFLYGVGLAYSGIPEDILKRISKELRNRGFAG